MVFWTLVFITLCVIFLVKGSAIYNTTMKVGDLEIRKYEGGDIENLSMEQLKLLWFPMVSVVSLIIFRIVYLINALAYDIYKYPTIILMLILIISIVSMKSKKKDYNNSEELLEFKKKLYKTKKWTFKYVIINLMSLTYFCYMFYLLVF